MKIIISPAKKMVQDDCLHHKTIPVFIDKSNVLKKYIQGLTYEELKKLLCCSNAIANLNFSRYQDMDLDKNLSPALFSYDGIQYKYMAPQVFNNACIYYIEKNLRILSGLYGILKPIDGVVPYRLEMQAKLKTDFCGNLYDFWKDEIYKNITQDDNIILNLASDEYGRTVKRYITPQTRFVTCVFGELTDGQIKEKGVYVKMARGEMVRYMAEMNISNINDIKSFSRLGYNYNENLSNETTYVFLK